MRQRDAQVLYLHPPRHPHARATRRCPTSSDLRVSRCPADPRLSSRRRRAHPHQRMAQAPQIPPPVPVVPARATEQSATACSATSCRAVTRCKGAPRRLVVVDTPDRSRRCRAVACNQALVRADCVVDQLHGHCARLHNGADSRCSPGVHARMPDRIPLARPAPTTPQWCS